MINAPALRGAVSMKAKEERSLSLPSLGDIFGVTFHRLLGAGCSGRVYEVSGWSKSAKSRGAGKVFAGSDVKAARHARELALASWAHGRGIGPRVYGLRYGSWTEEGGRGREATMLLMEKMDGTLADLGGVPYWEAKLCWALAFELIEAADFSAAGAGGWLCCDDLKPENILVKRGKSTAVRLGDWDPLHWHSLPIEASEGRWLNRAVLVVNSLFSCRSTARGKTRFLQTCGLWPEAQLCLLACLASLARDADRQLCAFFKTYDSFLRRGPHHYVSLDGDRRRERASGLARALHEAFSFCFPDYSPIAEDKLKATRGALRNVAAAYRRACLARNTGRPAHERLQNSSDERPEAG
jgi:hypothetical protein